MTFDFSKQSLNDFYHESLDKMEEVLENVLTIHHKAKISEKSKLVDILFDGKNEEMNNMLDFVITKIHHNSTTKRIKINKKEYNYLWLELNKIIYLVTKYKQITKKFKCQPNLYPKYLQDLPKNLIFLFF